MTRVVLAYSGTRDTAAIPWLADTYGAEIVALTLDLGQGRELEAVRDRALAAGAVRAHVLDVAGEFARDYFLRALKADALYDGERAMATALGRPLIASKLLQLADIEQTTKVAHGCHGEDTRIAAAARALNPRITVIAAPIRIPSEERGPSIASKSAAASPHEPALVEITFDRGVPDAINGVTMPLLDLIGSLDIMAATHGIGRVDGLETPAAVVLSAAHRYLQNAAAADEANARHVTRQYIEVIDSGSWFTPERAALDTDVEKRQERVTGIVRLTLFNGDCAIVMTTPGTPGNPAFIALTKA